MKFTLGCSLVYHVPAPMPFVFNVEVASFLGQKIEQEQLSIDPQLPVERWTMPETGNRYLRVLAQTGIFACDRRGGCFGTSRRRSSYSD